MFITVFRVVMPYSLVRGYQSSSETLATTYKTTGRHNSEEHNIASSFK
jgi:hypothetical protein